MAEPTTTIHRMLAELEEYRTTGFVYDFGDGAKCWLRPSKVGDSIYIMNIRTAPSARGQGLASEVLATLCELADHFGVALFLKVEQSDGLNARQLLDWYWRHGFRGDATEMVREPRLAQGGQ